jgi:hypothetical protein
MLPAAPGELPRLQAANRSGEKTGDCPAYAGMPNPDAATGASRLVPASKICRVPAGDPHRGTILFL